MIQHKNTNLIPDGESISKFGKIDGCLVHIDNKVQTLKLQLMGKDARKNRADIIIHKLAIHKRLLTTSDNSAVTIYKAVRGVSSNPHIVNTGLATDMSCQLGHEWISDQLYCCIQSAFGFHVRMTKIWLRYQKKIGYNKMYPSNTRFDLGMEDKSLKRQISNVSYG